VQLDELFFDAILFYVFFLLFQNVNPFLCIKSSPRYDPGFTSAFLMRFAPSRPLVFYSRRANRELAVEIIYQALDQISSRRKWLLIGLCLIEPLLCQDRSFVHQEKSCFASNASMGHVGRELIAPAAFSISLYEVVRLITKFLFPIKNPLR
jgi:hypothetical protein